MKDVIFFITLILAITLFAENSERAMEEPKTNNPNAKQKRLKKDVFIKITESYEELSGIAESYNIGTDSTDCTIEVKFNVNAGGKVFNTDVVSSTCNNTSFEQEIENWLKTHQFNGEKSDDTTDFTFPFTFGGKHKRPE